MLTIMTNKPKRSHFSGRNPALERGFTLIELLMSITIILVLATVVTIVAIKVRESAYRANATNALKQIATMNAAYSIENNGDINTLRDAGDVLEGRNGENVKDSFWGRLQPFLFPDASAADQVQLAKDLNLHLDRLFGSPDADTMKKTILNGSKIYHDGSGLPVPIAFNMNLYQSGVFKKVSNFNDPAQILYAAYGYGMFDEVDGKTYVARPTNNSVPANNLYYLENRNVIASFLDGHVESLTAPIPDRKFK
jgi:prepilin-type N-terminal cleavage/methylation domain-containing protein